MISEFELFIPQVNMDFRVKKEEMKLRRTKNKGFEYG